MRAQRSPPPRVLRRVLLFFNRTEVSINSPFILKYVLQPCLPFRHTPRGPNRPSSTLRQTSSLGRRRQCQTAVLRSTPRGRKARTAQNASNRHSSRPSICQQYALSTHSTHAQSAQIVSLLQCCSARPSATTAQLPSATTARCRVEPNLTASSPRRLCHFEPVGAMLCQARSSRKSSMRLWSVAFSSPKLLSSSALRRPIPPM